MLHVQQELWHYQLRGREQEVLKKTDKIEQLLAGAYRDPESGEAISVATKSLVIAPSLEGMEADLVAGLSFGPTLAVVSDQTTHEVLGAQVESSLAGRH